MALMLTGAHLVAPGGGGGDDEDELTGIADARAISCAELNAARRRCQRTVHDVMSHRAV